MPHYLHRLNERKDDDMSTTTTSTNPTAIVIRANRIYPEDSTCTVASVHEDIEGARAATWDKSRAVELVSGGRVSRAPRPGDVLGLYREGRTVYAMRPQD